MITAKGKRKAMPKTTPMNPPSSFPIHAPSPDTPWFMYLTNLPAISKTALSCRSVYMPEPAYQECPQTGSVSLPKNFHSNQSVASHLGHWVRTATLSSKGLSSAFACGLLGEGGAVTSP